MTLLTDHPGEQRRGVDIDAVISELQNIRAQSQQIRYKDGAIPELPSKSAIKEIVDGLISILYPRHFGPAELSPEAVVEYQRHTLVSLLLRLQRQIIKELNLSAYESDVVQLNVGRRAIEIANDLASALPSIRSLLDKDVYAAFAGDPSAKSMDEIIFCYPGFAAVTRHRIAHRLYLSGAPIIARIISEMSHSETSIDIHPGAEIGEGFFIDHGAGVVIGETAIIGRNVRIYQSVTLGARRFESDEKGVLVKGKPRHPIIEDGVIIYAGATILGRVTIGKDSSIGGNVWLTESVAPLSSVTQAKARTESFDSGGGI
jgi:serine O-acetyltransferase